MALQLSYQPRNTSYVFPNAYIKVNFVQAMDGLLLFSAEVFPNQSLRDSNRSLLETIVNMAPDDENEPDKTAAIYTWMKTQPEFENAVDV